MVNTLNIDKIFMECVWFKFPLMFRKLCITCRDISLDMSGWHRLNKMNNYTPKKCFDASLCFYTNSVLLDRNVSRQL